MSIINVKTVEEFERLQKKPGILVCHFQAEWAPQCKQINDVIKELATQPDTKDVVFANIMAEDLPEVSQRLAVSAVPTVIVTSTAQEGGQAVVAGRVDGAKPADLTTMIKRIAAKASLTGTGSSRVVVRSSEVTPSREATHNSETTPSSEATPSSDPDVIKDRLKKLIHEAPCMLFMKGTPEEPKCGFSRTTIALLNQHNAEYRTFDILTDDEVRQGLKSYSNWPTYPQLYLNGSLVGGVDILKEMDKEGELADMLPKKVKLEDRLKALISKATVMVFMKGDRESPRCGFSRTLIQILNETSISFETFDILTDEEVRQGLKSYSEWPTYPQVYVKGSLIGGLDIIKELVSDGTLKETLTA